MNLKLHIQKLDQVFGYTVTCPLFLPPFPHIEPSLLSKNGHLALLLLTYVVSIPKDDDTLFLKESVQRKCGAFIESYFRFNFGTSSSNSSLPPFLHPPLIYPVFYEWMVRTAMLKPSSISLLLLFDAFYNFASFYSISDLQVITRPWYPHVSSSVLTPLLSFLSHEHKPPCDISRLFVSLTIFHQCCSATVNWVDDAVFMELGLQYPSIEIIEEKAAIVHWASTWLAIRFQLDPGWVCPLLESMFSLTDDIDIQGVLFQKLPFMVDLAKAFSATEIYAKLKASLDPLFHGTYEKLERIASNILWPPSQSRVQEEKELEIIEDVHSPLGKKLEKALTLEPLDPILKKKVLSYMYDDDFDDEADEPEEGVENDTYSCPVAVKEAYMRDPLLFQRKAKNSSDREKLRKLTGLTDEQIEGWGSYLRRNPKEVQSIVSDFSGQTSRIQSTRYSTHSQDEGTSSQASFQPYRYSSDSSRYSKSRGWRRPSKF